MRIPITRPAVGEEEARAASEAILSGWLSQGPRVQEFERRVADYVGAKHAIATSNCTTALHLALREVGVGPGDEVICPSLSFIATANVVLHCGAAPVFVDIERATLNIDATLIEAAITPRTKAIIPVDQIGLAADMPAILAIARKHGLAVVEDAAPSLGASVGEARVGGMSPFTCFSFHPRKSITTGEGGMITTNDDAAADRLRVARSHGASTSDLSRHLGKGVDIEEYPELGFNYRMTDMQAAIGIVQVGKLDAIVAARRVRALRYSEMLANEARLVLPVEPAGRTHTFQSYAVWLQGTRPRQDIMADLADQGIATRRGVMAIHMEPLYRDAGGSTTVSLPVTEAATAETMLLPLYADMTDDEQDAVVEALVKAL